MEHWRRLFEQPKPKTADVRFARRGRERRLKAEKTVRRTVFSESPSSYAAKAVSVSEVRNSRPDIFPPKKIFVWQVDSATDGGLGKTKFREA